MAAIRNSLIKTKEPYLSSNVMHTIKHYDSNFTGELFHLARIILLICQQRFLFNISNVFHILHKNALFNVVYSWGQHFFTSMH